MAPVADLSQLNVEDGVYSYADYLTWQFDQAVELIKGKIFPMSAPSRRHQGISRELNGIFYNHFKGNSCAFYAAPFDVRLFDKRKSVKANRDILTVVQPDICVICDPDKLDDKGCLGAPDLVVEILSPGNSSKEMKLKKQLYEENGIREYWIIDPEHETAFQFHLAEPALYGPVTIYVSDEQLTSVIFPGLVISLIEVFASF
ncbi:MAG: Uma2 family endonuclease [Rudanella sp.]|nr:Uma2 family endonuclease [Rudanella sp.]